MEGDHSEPFDFFFRRVPLYTWSCECVAGLQAHAKSSHDDGDLEAHQIPTGTELLRLRQLSATHGVKWVQTCSHDIKSAFLTWALDLHLLSRLLTTASTTNKARLLRSYGAACSTLVASVILTERVFGRTHCLSANLHYQRWQRTAHEQWQPVLSKTPAVFCVGCLFNKFEFPIRPCLLLPRLWLSRVLGAAVSSYL